MAHGGANGLNYVAELEKCKEFLRDFRSDYTTDDSEDVQTTKYMAMLQEVANRTRRLMDIELDDLTAFCDEQGDSLAQHVMTNTRRYQMMFADAADELMPVPTTSDEMLDDVVDVLMRHRANALEENAANDPNAQAPADDAQVLPNCLKRRYEVRFVPTAKHDVVKLRQVKAEHIGQLVSMKAIVTRVGDVRPLMQVVTYTCDDCGYEIYQEVTSATFNPLDQCPSSRCKTNAKGGMLHLQTRGCKFQKFQEVRVQELAEEVPIGSIPRTLNVQMKGELTRSLAPGDVVDLTGIFLPIQFTGFKAMRAGLVANVYLECMQVKQHKKKYSEHVMTDEMKERLLDYSTDREIYSKLARSLAPEIFGFEDVKKAIMLLMVGGVSKTLSDKLKLRGDMHMCLMGDPGVAKSQLLKYVCKLAPRAVYTTGRGSSGVGLTASVMRDPVTQDMTLEGGALVLADMGVCCIDEFDKMEETDRTAIHEVMEQQTVSIAKAGITTTLNARTSVLAAANPAWGRYDLRRTPEENIALPAALLSRFDILWLILDRADDMLDTALAQHVLHVHRRLEAPELDFQPMPPADIRAYIAAARSYDPVIPEALGDYISVAYAELRAEEQQDKNPTTYTTARTLLSILRLAQALARLRFSDTVLQPDVDEALRLMKMSKVSLSDEQDKRNPTDAISAIYSHLRNHAMANDVADVDYSDALKMIVAKGHTQALLNACLEEYEALNVWQLDSKRNITFVS